MSDTNVMLIWLTDQEEFPECILTPARLHQTKKTLHLISFAIPDKIQAFSAYEAVRFHQM